MSSETDTPTTCEDNNGNRLPLVAIGASAGGLEQIRVLLRELPMDTGAAFVVMQHLAPDHESHLTDLLGQATELPVVVIDNDMAPLANQVHVLAPGHSLGIADGVLQATANQTRQAVPTLIDRFFRALAETWGSQAVGIVLSGTGGDGALGLKAIRGAGGLALAQNPETAEFDGMPRAAAKNASPGCVLDTRELVATLCNHLRLNLHPERCVNIDQPAPPDEAPDEARVDGISDEDLGAVLDLLRGHGQYHFRNHKPNMLKRRMARRMGLKGMASAADYLHLLEENGQERARLCGDFLISVTDFFREPQAYKTLEKTLARLLRARHVDAPLRVWVPGCATGEEVYSIAMLLAEQIALTGQNFEYVVFASDLDEAALEVGRAGLYPDSIESDLSAERLERFFNKVDSHYEVKSSLRERVVFAAQSVIDDPPYSRLDLISCRNLLIYLNADAQKRLIALFNFALKDAGILFLGGSESIGEQVDLFEPISKEHRLFRRIGGSPARALDFPMAYGGAERARAMGAVDDKSRPNKVEQIARDILLSEHVPASVVINRRLEILCSYGPTEDYLALPAGKSSLALIDMVRADYRSHVRAVIHKAFRYDELQHIDTALADDDSNQALQIMARPLREPEAARGLLLITFKRIPVQAPYTARGEAENDLEQQLADELEATRRELNSSIHALEASNEDLKGSNEEIMSMNEELQSTNEELETSKEELQSVNEELKTVNTELETKVGEVEAVRDDLRNLFSGSQVATLFLDPNMRIKRFTPAIRDLFNLIESDTGRPLRDMTRKFSDPELIRDCEAVLDDLTPREKEIQGDAGTWYLRRSLPYRTRNNVIDGVVITFVNIDDLKRVSMLSKQRERQLDLATSAVNGGMWDMVLDPDKPDELPDEIYLSARLKQLLGFGDNQLANSLHAWQERIVAEDLPAFNDLAQRREMTGSGAGLHYRIRHRDGSIRWFASYGTVIRDDRGRPVRWIGIDCDVTDRQQADRRARHALAQLRLLADALPALITFIDSEQVFRFSNIAFNDWFGLARDAVTGRTVEQIVGDTTYQTLAPYIDTALAGKAVSCELTLARPGHGPRRLQADLIPHVAENTVLGCYILLTDAMAKTRRRSDRTEQQANLVTIHRLATVGEMASTLAHDMSQPLTAINTYAGALMRMLHAGKSTEETGAILQKISEQVRRASAIVGDAREFVGHRSRGQDDIDLNTVLHRAVGLLESRAERMNIDIRLALHTPLPPIKGYAVQIEQVVVNLINNAFDAMENIDRTGRILNLTTEMPDAEHMQLRVIDSGDGIAPDKIATVFDAFHTTKLDGMGMGLSISRSIAQSHGGQLWAESRQGSGATFLLRLPVQVNHGPQSG